MALVNAFRFSRQAGGICVDEESWHLMRRKTYFSDCLYPLVGRERAEETGLELVYGGVGHPPFHKEVAERARLEVERWLADPANRRPSAQAAARLVLGAFRQAQRRRIDDRLRFLFGFTLDELTAGAFVKDGQTIPLRDQAVVRRALDIANLNENPGYGELSPPNQACIIALDPEYGYEGYSIKSKDGVISFHSCGFDSLGMGRYASAVRISKELNERWLDSRRAGPGRREGIWLLLSSMIEAFQHFGQVGGNVRLYLLDGEKKGAERCREVADERARLALELVRAGQAGWLPLKQAKDLLSELCFGEGCWTGVEGKMFAAAPDPLRLDAFLRGYKVEEEAGLPVNRLLAELYPGGAR